MFASLRKLPFIVYFINLFDAFKGFFRYVKAQNSLEREELLGEEIWAAIQEDTEFAKLSKHATDIKKYCARLPVIIRNYLHQEATDEAIQAARTTFRLQTDQDVRDVSEAFGNLLDALMPKAAAALDDEALQRKINALQDPAVLSEPIRLNKRAAKLQSERNLTILYLLTTDPLVFFRGVLYNPDRL